MEKQAIISVKNLRMNYAIGDMVVHALRGVDLDIHRGEFVAIMGPSGSGKSTMLNILGCLDRPTSGIYTLEGLDIAKFSKNEMAEVRNKKMGFVFQAYNLLPRTSALENVELPLLYSRNISARQRRELAKEALIQVGLEDRMDHLPNQLSGGQQQRVAIARALVNDPVVILADEATGNLDTRTSYEIMALFQKLNDTGKTIVFVTHESDIARFMKRSLLFKDGRLQKSVMITDRFQAKKMLEELPEVGEE